MSKILFLVVFCTSVHANSEIISTLLEGEGRTFLMELENLIDKTPFIGSSSDLNFWIGLFSGSIIMIGYSSIALDLKYWFLKMVEKNDKTATLKAAFLFDKSTISHLVLTSISFNFNECTAVDDPFERNEVEEIVNYLRCNKIALNQPSVIEKRIRIYKKSKKNRKAREESVLGSVLIAENDFFTDFVKKILKANNAGECSCMLNNYITFEMPQHDEVQDFKKYFNKLSDGDPNTVKDGIENILKKSVINFNKNLNNKIGLSDKESSIHGFIYGMLSLNFKKTYTLDIVAERLTGRGRIDLQLMSRRIRNPITIFIEIKSGKTKTPADGLKQIQDKGYYVQETLRTNAQKVVLIGLNPQFGKDNAVASFIQDRSETYNLRKFYLDPSSDTFKKAMTYFYFVTRSTELYFINFLIGQAISLGLDQTQFYDDKENNYGSFLLGTNKVLLNIRESSAKVPTNFLSLAQSPLTYNFFYSRSVQSFQSFPSRSGSRRENSGSISRHWMKLESIDVNYLLKMLREQKNVEAGNIFQQAILNLKSYIEKEDQLQAIVHGIFFGHETKNNNYITALAETNVHAFGRLDLYLIFTPKDDQYEEEDPIVIELKVQKEGSESAKNNAVEQAFSYSNVGTTTYANSFLAVGMTWDMRTGKVTLEIKDGKIRHNSPAKPK